jgi:translocation and assembly module TamB
MSTTPQTPRRRKRWLWVFVGFAAVVLVLVGGLAVTIYWALNTPAGLVAIARAVSALTPVRIAIEQPQGSVRHGFALARLKVTVDTTEVDMRDLRASLSDFDIQPLRFDFSALSAAAVDVRVRPSASTTTGPPDSIASPVGVSAARLQVGEFALRVGADPNPTLIAARAIDGAVTLGPDSYRVDRAEFEFGRLDAPLMANAKGTLGGAHPFVMQVDGTLKSNLEDKPLAATLGATGSLERFVASGQLSSGGANGSFEVTVASFAAPALQAIRADLRGIDPRVWSESALQADLRVQIDLKPIEGPQFGMAGPVRVDNATPGPVDAEKIPARFATGTAHWTAEALAIDNVVAELVRGSARGRFGLTFLPKTAWHTEARLAGVDPSTIHRRLRPLRIDGELKAQQEGSDTRVVADLRNKGDIAATLNVDLSVSAERLAIKSARLVLGNGNIDVVGEMALRGTRRINVNGSAVALDPALLVEGTDAQLTGIFALDARLEPQVSGDLDFELAESAAFGRPLAGRGTASLSPSQQLAVDLDLTVRSARLRASGGLGAPGRQLNVDIDAPALDELTLPVKGAVVAHTTLTGDWRAPSVEARLQGTRLAYGPHGIEEVKATLTYTGGSDGMFNLRADLTGHRWVGNPVASMRAAALSAEGRLSAHSVTLHASYDQEQTARLAATGGWTQRHWRGQLTEANAGAPVDLRLLEAATVEIDETGARFGPARLVAIGASITDLRVEVRNGILTTSGSFDDWRPGELVVVRQVNMIPRGPRESLVLRGAWRLRASDVVDGEVSVERVSGDLYATSGGDAPMGVTDLSARANVRANRLEAEGVLRGSRLGALRATMTASVERDRDAGWRLAQARPWRIDADADLPSIEWVNSLLSDRVRASVRIGGRLNGKLAIAGTPAKPQADGHVEGSGLRVAWIEQGVRFENGHLAARVDADSFVLDELRFAGPPRVKPNDTRTAQAMARMEPGFVVATGKLKLPELSGVIQIQAERLPLLQRVDRWVVATGGANIELAPKRVQLNGAVAVDAGFVDFTHPDLPGLSSDITVVASSSSAPRERESPVQVGFDLGLDPGQAFYLRGSGLNTRVAGAVRVRSEGRGIIRASGALNAVDGVYEGYGQRLKISRGRVNFQGPVDNPGLDVLALRTDLPQEAGDIGVSITRTAANPLIRLYSDPPLADYQTLSWLVLGRPAEQSGADNVALARAAVGLLAGSGEGISTTLAHQLGIDEISLRSGQVGSNSSLLPRQSVAGNLRGDTVGTAGAGAEIITIGKRFNDALSISYEQALSGAANVVALSYQLSRRVSLIARAGTENALDVVFSFAFD